MGDDRRVTVSQYGLAVQLVAPAEVVDDVARFTRPFLTIGPAGEADGTVPVVEVHRSPPAGSDWRRVVHASEYEPDRVVWVDDPRRRVALAGEASAWLTLQVVRSLRYLLRWQAYARGDLLLHGGLVAVGGSGIVFTGGRQSGKTSSILSLLAAGQHSFVSNDDVAITDTAEGLLGYGSPRTVAVRTDALLALADSVPAVSGLLAGLSHPTNGYRGRHHTLDTVRRGSGETLPGRLWVRCDELAAVTNGELRAGAPVRAVVLPRFDDSVREPAVVRLERAAAVTALAAHAETEATKYDAYLAAWFPWTDQARRAQLTDQLLSDARFFQLTQRMDDLPRATQALLGAVEAAVCR